MEMYIGFGVLFVIMTYVNIRVWWIRDRLQDQISDLDTLNRKVMGHKDWENGLVHDIRRLNKRVTGLTSTIDSTLHRTLHLLEPVYKPDLELVINTDNPEYDYEELLVRNGKLFVKIKSKEKHYTGYQILMEDGHRGDYKDYQCINISLDETLKRAKELRELKSKLCKPKCKKDK